MTKEEFEKSEKPLVLIVSFDPVNGKTIWDYYDWDDTDFWLNSIKNDFPKIDFTISCISPFLFPPIHTWDKYLSDDRMAVIVLFLLQVQLT